jgi:hypothetical protein
VHRDSRVPFLSVADKYTRARSKIKPNFSPHRQFPPSERTRDSRFTRHHRLRIVNALSLSLDSVALAGRRATIKSNAGAAIVRASALLRTSFYEAGLRDC